MTCDRFSLLPATTGSHGTTSRPLWSRMPTPGPVAYQVHSALLTARVISTGSDQVAPSSVLFVTQTVRPPLPARVFASVSWPRLCVRRSQTVPVPRSTTGQGLPQVPSPRSQTTCVCCQVLPPPRLRLRSRSLSPLSPRPCLRPSH